MRVERSTSIRAPREHVWELVSDPANISSYWAGVQRWDVVGEQARGLGARWSVRLQVGSAPLGGVVEVVEHMVPSDLAWTGITGISQRGRWRLRERTPGTTDVTLRLSYQSPGGVLGLVAERVAQPVVGRILSQTLARLRSLAEGNLPA